MHKIHKGDLMWLEAILTREDLAKALSDLCPLRICIGGGGSLVISEPNGVELVPEVGLRMTVTAEIHWPILGIAVPLTVRAVTLDLMPQILRQKDGREKLAFKIHLDQIDASLLPAFLDKTVVDRINEELEAKHVELAWDFVETLSHVFELPVKLASARGIELKAAWGKVKTTVETLVLAISFHASIQPRLADPPASRAVVPVPSGSAKPASAMRRARTPFEVALFGGTLVCAGLGICALAQTLRRH
jgi:hypothetical protein